MNVREYYEGKTILITGCTGFLGKVVLEKLLRSIPNIKKLYVLVRPKAGVSAMERIKKEIFQSQCFDIIRKEHPNFMAFIEEKIVPVEGDIAEPQIIMDEQKLELIKNTVNIIINNAASIDFNLRLDHALQINYWGPKRLLALAQQCKHIEVMTHVSTCYVNADKVGYIDERIHEYPNDPDQVVEDLMKIPIQTLLDNPEQIIKPWPNTYTFTKSLAERSLQKQRGNVPFVILRPSVIIAATNEPYPGWGDSMAAAGPLTLFFCTGLCRLLESDPNTRADIIPVDFVSNAIIISTANQAKTNALNIVHCGSSHTNPVSWIKYLDYCIHYSKTSPFENTFGLRYIKPVSSKEYQARFQIENILPAKALNKLAVVTKNQSMQKQTERLLKMYNKWNRMYTLFYHFFSNDWCFETKQLLSMLDRMSPEERVQFNCNPKTIDWKMSSILNVYGMQKFIFKMDVRMPYYEQSQLINRHPYKYFEDIQTMLVKGSSIKPVQLNKMFNKIIYSERVQSELRAQSKNISNNKDGYQSLVNVAKSYLNDLSSEINPKVLKPVFYLFHKQFRKIFDQIIINDTELKQLKSLVNKKKTSIILLPSYKSYLDYILLSYVHAFYEIDIPFVTALKQDKDMMLSVFDNILKKCGSIFFDDRHMKSQLHRVIMEEYLAQIMKQKHLFEYHIERKRERSGKIMRPRDFLFENIIDAYLRNQEEIKDVIFVPITINYDKIYEGQQFPYELLGELNREEIPNNLFKSIVWVTEKYGRVNINYCKPISMKDMINQYTQKNNICNKSLDIESQEIVQHKKAFISEFSKEITYTLSDNTVIMSTPMISSILLLDRRVGLNEENLLRKITWLYKEIQARNGLLSMSVPPSSTTLRTSLQYLGQVVDQKKDVFEPQVKAKMDYKSILMLAYYRNNLVHLFLNEGYISCALLGFGESVIESEGVSVKRLWEQTAFLANILNEEFMVRNQIQTLDQFTTCLEFMQARGFINITSDIVKVNQDKMGIKFLSSLIFPIVETYWVTISFLEALDKSITHVSEQLEQRVQQLAESLYDEGFLMYHECCSIETISNAIQKYANMDILKRQQSPDKGEAETMYYLGHEKQDIADLTRFCERLTFFRPVATFNTGLNIQDDVKRIISTKEPKQAKL